MNEHHNIIISMIKDITDTIITTFLSLLLWIVMHSSPYFLFLFFHLSFFPFLSHGHGKTRDKNRLARLDRFRIGQALNYGLYRIDWAGNG